MKTMRLCVGTQLDTAEAETAETSGCVHQAHLQLRWPVKSGEAPREELLVCLLQMSGIICAPSGVRDKPGSRGPSGPTSSAEAGRASMDPPEKVLKLHQSLSTGAPGTGTTTTGTSVISGAFQSF